MTKSKDIPRLPDAMVVTTLSIAIISHTKSSPPLTKPIVAKLSRHRIWLGLESSMSVS